MLKIIRAIMDSDIMVYIDAISGMIDISTKLLAILVFANKLRQPEIRDKVQNKVLSITVILTYLSIGLIIPIGTILLSESLFWICFAWFNISWFFCLVFIIYKMSKLTK